MGVADSSGQAGKFSGGTGPPSGRGSKMRGKGGRRQRRGQGTASAGPSGAQATAAPAVGSVGGAFVGAPLAGASAVTGVGQSSNLGGGAVGSQSDADGGNGCVPDSHDSNCTLGIAASSLGLSSSARVRVVAGAMVHAANVGSGALVVQTRVPLGAALCACGVVPVGYHRTADRNHGPSPEFSGGPSLRVADTPLGGSRSSPRPKGEQCAFEEWLALLLTEGRALRSADQDASKEIATVEVGQGRNGDDMRSVDDRVGSAKRSASSMDTSVGGWNEGDGGDLQRSGSGACASIGTSGSPLLQPAGVRCVSAELGRFLYGKSADLIAMLEIDSSVSAPYVSATSAAIVFPSTREVQLVRLTTAQGECKPAPSAIRDMRGWVPTCVDRGARASAPGRDAAHVGSTPLVVGAFDAVIVCEPRRPFAGCETTIRRLDNALIECQSATLSSQSSKPNAFSAVASLAPDSLTKPLSSNVLGGSLYDSAGSGLAGFAAGVRRTVAARLSSQAIALVDPACQAHAVPVASVVTPGLSSSAVALHSSSIVQNLFVATRAAELANDHDKDRSNDCVRSASPAEAAILYGSFREELYGAIESSIGLTEKMEGVLRLTTAEVISVTPSTIDSLWDSQRRPEEVLDTIASVSRAVECVEAATRSVVKSAAAACDVGDVRKSSLVCSHTHVDEDVDKTIPGGMQAMLTVFDHGVCDLIGDLWSNMDQAYRVQMLAGFRCLRELKNVAEKKLVSISSARCVTSQSQPVVPQGLVESVTSCIHALLDENAGAGDRREYGVGQQKQPVADSWKRQELCDIIHDMQDQLWCACDDAKDAADGARKQACEDAWLRLHVACIMNHYILMIEAETRRYLVLKNLMRMIYASWIKGYLLPASPQLLLQAIHHEVEDRVRDEFVLDPGSVCEYVAVVNSDAESVVSVPTVSMRLVDDASEVTVTQDECSIGSSVEVELDALSQNEEAATNDIQAKSSELPKFLFSPHVLRHVPGCVHVSDDVAASVAKVCKLQRRDITVAVKNRADGDERRGVDNADRSKRSSVAEEVQCRYVVYEEEADHVDDVLNTDTVDETDDEGFVSHDVLPSGMEQPVDVESGVDEQLKRAT